MRQTILKVEDFINFLLSKELINEEDIILKVHLLDSLDTIIIESGPDEKRALLDCPIDKRNFSVRFNQAIRGDNSIKTIRDLRNKSIEELQKLPGFKKSCTNELLAFYQKHDFYVESKGSESESF
jgi:hypothetical protein